MAANTVNVNNQVEFQNALNNARTQTITCINVTNDIIQLTSPLALPKNLFAGSKTLVINGNGATIQPAPNISLTALFQRPAPIDRADAVNNMVDNRFIIRDLHFWGQSRVNTGVDLGPTYGSHIENCHFRSLVNGLHLRFCLMARVVNCMTNDITGSAFIADRASNILDPGLATTQSNHTRFEQCRVFNAPGAFAAFNIIDASGVTLEQCISEGGSPQYHVYFDSMGSTVVKEFNMRGTHVESAATRAAIKLILAEGYAKISDLYAQNDNQVLICAESVRGYPHLYVENVPWLTPNMRFETVTQSGVVWSFKECYQGGSIFNSSRWVNGIVPYYRYSEYFDQAPRIIASPDLKINNTTF